MLLCKEALGVSFKMLANLSKCPFSNESGLYRQQVTVTVIKESLEPSTFDELAKFGLIMIGLNWPGRARGSDDSFCISIKSAGTEVSHRIHTEFEICKPIRNNSLTYPESLV